MQNRTPIAAAARPPLPDFTPVPRKYRHDGWTPERGRGRWGVGGRRYSGGLSRMDRGGRGAGRGDARGAAGRGAEVKKRPSWRPARKATGN